MGSCLISLGHWKSSGIGNQPAPTHTHTHTHTHTPPRLGSLTAAPSPSGKAAAASQAAAPAKGKVSRCYMSGCPVQGTHTTCPTNLYRATCFLLDNTGFVVLYLVTALLRCRFHGRFRDRFPAQPRIVRRNLLSLCPRRHIFTLLQL
jgi:hypothetical protein